MYELCFMSWLMLDDIIMMISYLACAMMYACPCTMWLCDIMAFKINLKYVK